MRRKNCPSENLEFNVKSRGREVAVQKTRGFFQDLTLAFIVTVQKTMKGKSAWDREVNW